MVHVVEMGSGEAEMLRMLTGLVMDGGSMGGGRSDDS